MRVATKDKRTRASPTIDDLITRFEMSNVVDGKSPKTIRWYNDILKFFSRYLKENSQANGIDGFSIENAREYVLYLRSRNRFDGHPFILQQHSLLSPQTVRGHIRGLKALSSWLYREGCTDENQGFNRSLLLRYHYRNTTMLLYRNVFTIKAILFSIRGNIVMVLAHYAIAHRYLLLAA